MKTTNRTFALGMWVIGYAVLTSLAVAEEQFGAEARIKKMQEEWSVSAGEIVFYGKVVDQYNQPVAGVTISVNTPIPVGYMQARPRRCQVQSDNEGRFEVTKRSFGLNALKGSFLFIDSIEKNGYEYIRGTDPNLGFSYRHGYTDKHLPDSKNPIVFHIRKKEAVPIFLIEERYLELRVDAGDSGKSLGYDFIQRARIKDVQHTRSDANLICDLQLKATFNASSVTWIVTLFTGNTNGGIITSEQLLYEAPQDGYRLEYIFTPEDHKTPTKRYIYLRSRNPAIYSRIEIQYINANKEFFRLSGKSATNPYGDRNFEQVTDLPWEVAKQLTDEVRTAFRQNKRPEKPDLPKLLKEAKEKAEKEKK